MKYNLIDRVCLFIIRLSFVIALLLILPVDVLNRKWFEFLGERLIISYDYYKTRFWREDE